MTWKGTWRNQFGSIVEIRNDDDGRIEGYFRTALRDSGFHGQDVAIVGIHQGDCISFAAAGKGPAGDLIVSYTGLLRDGRMETLWFVVADASLSAPSEGAPAKIVKTNWWRAANVNADTFERITSGSHHP